MMVGSEGPASPAGPDGPKGPEGREGADATPAASYQDLIFQHASRPLWRGPLPAPAASATSQNRLCGDSVTVYLAWDQHGGAEIGFDSEGCALCRASASILAAAGRGLPRDALAALAAQVRVGLAGAAAAPPPGLPESVVALFDLRRFPSRERCVLLAWEALTALVGGGDAAARSGLAPS